MRKSLKYTLYRILLLIHLFTYILLGWKYNHSTLVNYFIVFNALFNGYLYYLIKKDEKNIKITNMIDDCDKVKGQWG